MSETERGNRDDSSDATSTEHRQPERRFHSRLPARWKRLNLNHRQSLAREPPTLVLEVVMWTHLTLSRSEQLSRFV
jgi:hypothetical protein